MRPAVQVTRQINLALNTNSLEKSLRMTLFSDLNHPALCYIAGAVFNSKLFVRRFGALFLMFLAFAVACLIGCVGAAPSAKSSDTTLAKSSTTPIAKSSGPASPDPRTGTSLQVATTTLPVGTIESRYDAMLAATGGSLPILGS